MDSGITIMEKDSLISVYKQQQLHMKLKDRKIEQLEKRIEDLEDVVTSCKFHLKIAIFFFILVS